MAFGGSGARCGEGRERHSEREGRHEEGSEAGVRSGCLEASGGAGQGGTWLGVSSGFQTPGTPGPKVPFPFLFPWRRTWGFSPPRGPFPLPKGRSPPAK